MGDYVDSRTGGSRYIIYSSISAACFNISVVLFGHYLFNCFYNRCGLWKTTSGDSNITYSSIIGFDVVKMKGVRFALAFRFFNFQILFARA